MDDAFVQAPEHRPVAPVSEATGVPVIDLSPLAATPPPPAGAVDALFAQATAARAAEAGRAFFALAAERKAAVRRTEPAPLGYYDAEHTKNVRDWKDVFDIFPRELPPPPAPSADGELVFVKPGDGDLPGFKLALEEYAAAMEELAFKLLELIARSLNLRPDRLHGFFREQTTYLRPPCPRPDLALGLGRRKDSGALTVRRPSTGEWARVRLVRGSLVVNVGDIIQVWSNDRYESVEHQASVNSEQERFSIPYFFNPARRTAVEPLEEMVSEERPSRYNAYDWGEFCQIRGHRVGTRSNFRKLDVDNIQIAHLRKDRG
ncbi:hypothetical protein GQ55_9G159800 [Panicum hallii var. hallii]|uniref:Fe2OG dioxygenase domain-containing protein n=1 Tax=Panicum hallii var. hallii TaxID=1504633 RepID=A0A2T7C3S4_9POAL|nr:hypothetical protein GQ55_9G159800 [Panicum hallii var. hallii]